jgi:hypothetical protein
MNEKLRDILSNLNTDIDQEILLQYLQGKLSDEKKHEVEMQLLNSDFEVDALEGLQQFKDKGQLNFMMDMLNKDLQKKIEKKKKRREKLKIKDQPWLYISLVILLILIVISYIMIRKLLQQ